MDFIGDLFEECPGQLLQVLYRSPSAAPKDNPDEPKSGQGILEDMLVNLVVSEVYATMESG